ncbi:hypothetical protein [Cohnella abietis]|uniref:Uncharacterized protein n=1 Tax=Cohnella abietis TaxID=2507935 RepID=A0A3T1CY39_9BACL|nr:hypothetical protein [Cohnella abietis]BBI30748.1 hypothetical protein KCTCHS21_01470 [Cohnella abietis]
MGAVPAEQLKKFFGLSPRICMAELLAKMDIPHEIKANRVQTDLAAVKAKLHPVYARKIVQQRLITISQATGILQKDITEVFILLVEKQLKCYMVNKQIRLDRLDVYRCAERRKALNKAKTMNASLLLFRLIDIAHLMQLSYRRTAYLLSKRALTNCIVIKGPHKIWIARSDVIQWMTDFMGEVPTALVKPIPKQVPLVSLREYIPVCDKTIEDWLAEGMPLVLKNTGEVWVETRKVVNWLKKNYG